MKKMLVLLLLCVWLSLTETLSRDFINDQRNKELIMKNKLQPANQKFFGILLVPYIICFFAATGIWPHIPQHMQSSVNEMGQQIFAQSDDQILFLKGIFFPIIKGDPFVPADDWITKATTLETKATTIRQEQSITTATTKARTITEPVTTVTTEATTTPATTTIPPTETTPETTTTTPSTTETTPNFSVITFTPVACNCSQPQVVQRHRNSTSVKVEKNVNKSPLPSTTATTPTHIKIDVKNVISFIDLILSYLNLTRSSP